MNVTRMVVLSVAFAAAGGAALLVRSGVGGNRTARPAAVVPVTNLEDVLVASTDIAAGKGVEVTGVRWQSWPKDALNPSFTVRSKNPDMAKDVSGAIARVPLVAGEPITETNIVRAGATGF